MSRRSTAPAGRRQFFVLVLATMTATPLLLVFSGWLQVDNDVWRHLAENVLAELVLNTLSLLIGVATGVAVLGVGLARLTAWCEFPGRRFFDWALMLPLAVPAYVLAFVALGLMDYFGPVQTFLRAALGAGSAGLPEFRSLGGLICVMVLTLYPYVYMLTRAAFLTQGRGTLEAARSLGMTRRQAFYRMALPMARPAIIAGISLALMETLADFGTVAVFNYDTFTTAIYKTWFGLFNLAAAGQLASLLLLFVVLALATERRLRGHGRFHETGRGAAAPRRRLAGWRGVSAAAACALIMALAFVIPVAQLVGWSWKSLGVEVDRRYLDLLANTLLLGIGAALATVSGALVLAFAKRGRGGPLTRTAVHIATLGYALPGSVLAVGIMMAVSGLDNFAISIAHAFGVTAPGPFVGGTVLALLAAYLVRFMAVAYGPVDSGLERIRTSLAEAARSLGASRREVLLRVQVPLLRPGLLTALLLVLVDVMKEMPATLLLRPFGWDTLAVRIYEMTSEGEWERAALPAVTLVLLGLLPVIVLVRKSAAAHGEGHRTNH